MSFVPIRHDRNHSSNLDEAWTRWVDSAINFDRSKGEAISRIVADILSRRKEIGLRVREYLLCEHPEDFVLSCFSIAKRPQSLDTFVVPEPLRNVGSIREKGLGAGELLLLFMVPNAVWNPGKAIDAVLFNENWHIKQIRRNDRRAKMGGAKDTRYSSSNTAHKLYLIDSNFPQEVTNTALRLNRARIEESFGSIDDFWKIFRSEFIQREFSDVVGICFYDEDNNVVEFHEKQDVILVGATQGSYRVKAFKVVK